MKNIIFIILFFCKSFCYGFIESQVNVFTGEFIEENHDLMFPGPYSSTLYRSYGIAERSSKKIASEWHFNFPDLFEQEIPRARVPDAFNCSIDVTHDAEKRVQNIQFFSKGSHELIDTWTICYESSSCTIQTESGDSVRYFFRYGNGKALLEEVHKNGILDCRYTYIAHPKERKYLISSKQFASGDRLEIAYEQFEKVKTLSYCKNGFPTVTCSFTYTPGCTEVCYSSGLMKKYFFNSQQEIEKIEEFEEGNLSKSEQFVWESGHLLSTSIFNPSHQLEHCTTYSYDPQGNLTQETLSGNLSGKNETEFYSKQYIYSDDGRLLEKHEDNGIGHQYQYKNDLLVADFLLDGEHIIAKTFYRYNSNFCLLEEVHESGQDFTCREETIYGPFHTMGMPLKVIDKNGCHEFSYSPQGKLEWEKYTNEHGALLSLDEWTYDSSGKHVHRLMQDKESYCSYDIKGHLCYEWASENNFETIYTYQFDTLSKVEKKYFDGTIETATFRYDERGNLIAQSDFFGNETHYEYDSLNRKIAECAPALEKEMLYTSFAYDCCNNKTAVTNPKGHLTATTFNSRGQPVTIRYPDGSQESFVYALDGTLKEECGRNQRMTQYEYDASGNIKTKVFFSSDSLPLETIEYGYQGSKLLFENSSLYGTTHYSYDSSGKILHIENCQKRHHSDFTYDCRGKLVEKHELWEQAPEMAQCALLAENSIAIYNHLNQCCYEKTSKPNPEPICEKATIINALGQTVLEKRFCDEAGNHFIIQYNAYQAPILEIKQDPFKQELYTKHFGYDALGNKTRETFCTKGQEPIVTVWNYGPMNLLEETIEFYGTALQRSHHYQYNLLGQLTTIVKPDGIQLYYEYDGSGKVKRQFSSDATIDYSFTYDTHGNLIIAEDHILQSATERFYNEQNQLIQEVLASGLSIKNEYDAVGRRNVLTLPDGSSAHYRYDTLFLKEVTRKDSNNTPLYQHAFTSFDLQGNPLVAKLIGDLGEVHSTNSSISSPYHICQRESEQMILMHPYGIEKLCYTQDSKRQITAEMGTFEENHIYDALGNHLSHWQTKYDLNGNLIFKAGEGQVFEYEYDAIGRMTTVSLNGCFVARYVYDCFHRRIAKKTGDDIFYFLHDGIHEIGKVAADGTLLEFRLLGNAAQGESSATLAIELLGETFAPLHDLCGSIVGLVSMERKCIEELYCYSAFGKEKKLFGSIKNPWRYAGKRTDPETGCIFFGRRYYDPQQGRWMTPDPAGYTDGPNLYAFAKNDPINNRDAYGLFSFKSFLYNVFHPLEFFDRLLGKIFHYLCGYNGKPQLSGVYGQGEVSNKVRVTMINGMVTNEYWLLLAAKALSESHGGVNVHYVHRPPSNFFLDAMRAYMSRQGCVSPHARLLADTWKELIHEMGGEGQIIHYAHSIGTCETMAALSLMTKEEQDMIKIYSFGSPCLSNKHNYHIHHFVSVRDGICLLDLPNLIKAAKGENPYVTFVGSFLGVPLIDHLFSTKSYVDIWSAMGKTFVEWYGSLI